ncbi:hypothetical protein JCGZ_17192 [Jatropha curcas]|uniref:Uncharacterized protein n=1 Tax=Jatropha curcas TaxID=180498 RepID=A0A067LLF1_JATCU|nr:stemmadenine O-acetyltransferase [Jatropha curcas]KDP45585.1 hypothetical protein JCGZ_17192 [Jatropha curcas]
MEVEIISKEFIKPSSSATQHQKPYKLTFFDQLQPAVYFPVIFFFPMNDSKSHINQTLTHLKKSLSETLNLYYPLSGRPNDDNIFISRFQEGLPFIEAKASCSMSDFLKLHETESLNSFLPCSPYHKELAVEIPLLAVQVSKFTCGGIALGCCFSHKLLDAATASNFIASWSSLHRGDPNGVIMPDFEEPSLFFPPKIPIPRTQISLMDTLCFAKGDYITRRFVFNAEAIDTLKAKAKGNEVDQTEPTRIQTLSCFIWKHCMEATRMLAQSSSSSASNTSVLIESVNLRKRTTPEMKDGSSGNLIWGAVAIADPNDTNQELHELVKMLSEAIALFKPDYTESFQGDNGFETLSQYFETIELLSMENPEVFVFTSWSRMSLTRPDFGWGEPYWVGVMGKVGDLSRNMTIFVDAKDGKGIEAWITLDDKRMEILQQNPEFLEFASVSKVF